jgi:16S rRNA (adenine1518-N6/adenine1519-N6)-dimethyltransferase
MARQRLGQHFLGDAGWCEKIARAIRVSPHGMELDTGAAKNEDCWIEIGAGHGEMTQHLVRSGAPVYALELDPTLVEGLKQLSEKHHNLTILQGDALQTDLGAIAAARRIRIYGNLPYYITSPLLHHFFEYADLVDEIHIVIQTEVALRLTARPGSKSFGYLSVITQFYTRPEIVLELPQGAFQPPPRVGSALVTLRFPGKRAELGVKDVVGYLEFVKSCFGQKRKTLANNLRAWAEPAHLWELLQELKLRKDVRAEQLNVGELAELYRLLGKPGKTSSLRK